MISRLVSACTRRLGIQIWRLFTRPLGRSAHSEPRAIELRFITAEERHVWTDPALGMTPAKAAEAFGRGDVCVGAFDGERAVGYAWFASRPAPHVDGLWMAAAEDSIYIYRALVRPEYRGRRIAPALYCFGDIFFLAQGKMYAIICVNIFNGASIAAAERSGARTAGYAAYWLAGRHFLAVRSRGAKAFDFSFYRA